jgi:hypothetical protein
VPSFVSFVSFVLFVVKNDVLVGTWLAKGRKVREGDDRYELREPGAAYNALFTPENGFYWNELFEQSIR